MKLFRSIAVCLLPVLLLGGGPDEGLWTFDHVPTAWTGTPLNKEWLDRVRRACVKIPGGSGAFVGREGLVITNQHVLRRWLQPLREKEGDLIRDGYVAKDRSRELPLPGLEVRTLETMVDVSRQVAQAVTPGMSEADALHAQRVAFANLKMELQNRTRLDCEQVRFHGGSQYWIYGYRRHKDVRLVWTPEVAIAAFGGDEANFRFPRFAMDACLLRVYEKGQPYVPSHSLPLATEGPKVGDLTLVAGHPWRTQRRETLAQMRFARDVSLPFFLAEQTQAAAMLDAFAARSPEHAKEVQVQRSSLANMRQASKACIDFLSDPSVMALMEAEEAQFKADLARRQNMRSALASFQRIARAQAALAARYAEFYLLDTGDCQILSHALLLHRMAVEPTKPSADRLPDFQDAHLPALREEVRNPIPINMELEREYLLFRIHRAQARLGPRHPFLRALLGGKAPEVVVDQALRDTRLHQAAFRSALLERGPKAIHACKDPFLVMARRLDPVFRQKRAWMDKDFNAPLWEHQARLGRARFTLMGHDTYPDANGTLRLSRGLVAQDGSHEAFSRIQGLYAQGGKGEAWSLPPRWVQRRQHVDPSLPITFAHSADVAPGSSGSPVVNAAGELLGVVFDGNLACLNANYHYDPATTRVISVDIRVVLEALTKVYDAPGLAAELRERLPAPSAQAKVELRPRVTRPPH